MTIGDPKFCDGCMTNPFGQPRFTLDSSGITLRDFFAGCALIAYTIQANAQGSTFGEHDAGYAWRCADAMLKARKD
jgi:hypothetical protein